MPSWCRWPAGPIPVAPPELNNVTSNAEDSGLSTYFEIDRYTAGRFWITPATVDNALYDSFGQRMVSTIVTQSNQYQRILEGERSVQSSLRSLDTLYLPAQSDGQVPLSTIATLRQMTASPQINYLGQFPAASSSLNVAPGVSLGEAVDGFHRERTTMERFISVITRFKGAALTFQGVVAIEVLLNLAAIITMHIVLSVFCESNIHPITIMSISYLPGIGALLLLMTAGSDLGMMGIVEIILPIGIIKKDAILLTDFALDAQRHRQFAARKAIYQTCLPLYRPILKSSMGALPLMVGTGTSSAPLHPLGTPIVGGRIFNQVLTLFKTPVIYLTFDRRTFRLRESETGLSVAAEEGRP